MTTDTADPIAAARALLEPMTGYTPGPWMPSDVTIHTKPHESAVAVCVSGGTRSRSEARSNANLIAAAPDLKDMLTAALAEIDRLREALKVEQEENRWAYVDAALKDRAEDQTNDR